MFSTYYLHLCHLYRIIFSKFSNKFDIIYLITSNTLQRNFRKLFCILELIDIAFGVANGKHTTDKSTDKWVHNGFYCLLVKFCSNNFFYNKICFQCSLLSTIITILIKKSFGLHLKTNSCCPLYHYIIKSIYIIKFLKFTLSASNKILTPYPIYNIAAEC